MPKLLKIAGISLGLILAAEVGAGYLNFQRGSERGLGLAWLADRVQSQLDSPDQRVISLSAVYEPRSTALRQVLEKSYSAEFDTFMQTARERSCAVAMLYIPTDPSFSDARAFYADLAERTDIPFIDMEPVKQNFGPELLYLTPGDTHPSRLLAHLTANVVAEHVRNTGTNPCKGDNSAGQALFGPWVNNLSEIRETAKGLAFRFTSDAFGFRATGIQKNNETAPSILLIGDSFTYGTSLAGQDTWPASLQNRLPEYQVFNAGVGGISIVRQHEILKKATQDTRADLVILQVNETDLQGLLPAYWTEMKRPPAHSEEIAGFFP